MMRGRGDDEKDFTGGDDVEHTEIVEATAVIMDESQHEQDAEWKKSKNQFL